MLRGIFHRVEIPSLTLRYQKNVAPSSPEIVGVDAVGDSDEAQRWRSSGHRQPRTQPSRLRQSWSYAMGA